MAAFLETMEMTCLTRFQLATQNILQSHGLSSISVGNYSKLLLGSKFAACIVELTVEVCILARPSKCAFFICQNTFEINGLQQVDPNYKVSFPSPRLLSNLLFLVSEVLFFLLLDCSLRPRSAIPQDGFKGHLLGPDRSRQRFCQPSGSSP